MGCSNFGAIKVRVRLMIGVLYSACNLEAPIVAILTT